MISIRTSHKWLWTIFAGGLFLIFVTDSWNLFFAFLLIAVGMHFLFHLVFSIKVLKQENFQAVLTPLSKHESSSPEILQAIFKDEMGAKDLVLPVAVTGRVSAKRTTKTPWTKRDVVGWSLDVWLYKKTVFGGASDYTPLLSQSHFEPFAIEERGTTVVVDEPGIVRGPARKEQLLTWSALEGTGELKRLVEERLKIAGFSKDGTTGIRVVETGFASSAPVTVWGQASSSADGRIYLTGNDQKGDEKALLVAGSNVSNKNGIRGGGMTVVNAAIVVALLAFGTYWTAVNFWTLEKNTPWLNFERVGKVQYKGDGGSWEVRLETLNLDNSDGWNLGPEDLSVDLIDGEAKAIVKGSTEFVLRRPKVSPFVLKPRSGAVVEKSDGYHLTLVERAPETSAQDVRVGQFYVFNRSDQAIELRFLTETPGIETLYWTMAAHAGENQDSGIRLLKKKNPIVLTEGDVVKIRPSRTQADQIEVLGRSRIVRWNSDQKAWTFEMNDREFRSTPAVLFVSNPFDFEVKVHVKDGQGKETKASWTLNARWGGTDGAVLKKEKFVYDPGDWIVVEPLDYWEAYRGPIDRYVGAVWNKDMWTITPKTAP